MSRILVITGPTASGKSGLAMELARFFPLEIISADSMQVYRYMNIGTAKPTQEEMALVRHHLVDVKDPDEPWSVQEFKERASRAIREILDRKHIPCVVGGTGLYVRALLRDYPLRDAPPDLRFRRDMRNLAKKEGNQAVHALLKDRDPESWARLHPNDHKRVVRALEYFRSTGHPISERQKEKADSPYDALKLGLSWNRQDLGERIDNRVEEQFRQGFVEEVMDLRKMGYKSDLASMQGLGYKEIGLFLDGLCTLEETKALIKRNTRRFAKRQFTWFSREEGIIWLERGQDIAWADVLQRASDLIRNHFEVDTSPAR
ncbi:MAG: tRNA (adenosine(37)-N6)-dimethylallyltransferase MiaA [Bacillota bacterium]